MNYIPKRILIFCLVVPIFLSGRLAFASSDDDRQYLQSLASAVQEIQAGSFDSAYQLLNVALEKRRDEGAAFLVRAIILANCSAWADADHAFQEAAEMRADPAMCAYGRAVCKLALRDFGNAEALLPSADRRVSQQDLRIFRVYTGFMTGKGLGVATIDSPVYSQLIALSKISDGKRSEASQILSQICTPDPGSAILDRGLAFGFDINHPVSANGTITIANRLLGRGQGKSVTGYSGKVRLRANREQSPGATYVLYYCDGDLIGVVNSPPFELDWDTTRVANGIHTIRMRGETVDGAVVGETSQQVLVSNIAAKPGRPVSGEAADALLDAVWACLKLGPNRTWGQFQLGRIAEDAGQKTQAMLCYERVLACQPFYKDTALRWKALAGVSPKEAFWKGSGLDSSVALTFDDGPNGGTQSLLDALANADAKATFFIVGLQARRYPDLLKEIASAGHELACHSETHRSMVELEPDEFIKELFGPIAIIHELTGKIPRFFRPPGGHLDNKHRLIASSFGLTAVMWSAHVGPYEGGSVMAMEQYTQSKIKAGAIVLLHNAEPTTLKALPAIVLQLRSKHFRLVGISQLAR